MSAPQNSPTVSSVKLLQELKRRALLLSGRESVALAVIARAKRRIVMKSIDENEWERLLLAARAAGDAEGYARAKFEMMLDAARAGAVSAPVVSVAPIIAPIAPVVTRTEVSREPEAAKIDKLETFRLEAEKAKKNEVYKTRITVTMTQAIALDYIKSVAPRIVGPSEIKKNSEKSLDIFISFGTLQRAMGKLVETGDVELVEASRWRFKGRADSSSLRSIK